MLANWNFMSSYSYGMPMPCSLETVGFVVEMYLVVAESAGIPLR